MSEFSSRPTLSLRPSRQPTRARQAEQLTQAAAPGSGPLPEGALDEVGRIAELKEMSSNAWSSAKKELPRTKMQVVEVFLPCLEWMRGYKWREWLLADVLAGIAATVMTVPENIANAGLAGAPAAFGLYSSILPSLAYAIWGGCYQMSVGCVAISMITLGDGLIKVFGELQPNPNVPEDPEMQAEINKAIIQISLMAATILFGLGFFRLGFLCNLMSYSVVAGYLAGAALLIIVSQLKYFLGLHTEHASTVQGVIQQVVENIDGFNWRDLLMGMCFLITLIVCKEIGHHNHKYWWLKAVGTLTCLIVGIGVMNIWDLYLPTDNPLVDPVGGVPKGWPPTTFSWWGPITEPIGSFMTAAVTTTLVILIESICMARKLAQEHRVQLSYDRELRAIGICNFFAAAFSTVPTSGSISRGAVVNQANGRTPFSGVVTFIAVLIITLWFTGVFTNMPMNLAGAIMVSAVYRVLNPMELYYCWLVSFFDFFLYLTTFCIVIFLGVYYGLLLGVLLAVVVHVYRTSYPPTAVLGRLPGTQSYRDVDLFPGAVEEEGVLMLRIDSGLFFANVPPLRNWVYEQVRKADERAKARGEAIAFLVLDISATHFVDADTVQFIKGLIEEMDGMGIRVVLVNQSLNVLRTLGSRTLDDSPAQGDAYQHHFGALKSALHVNARAAAAGPAAAEPGDMHASALEGDGEVFRDAASALQHCSTLVQRLGLSKRHTAVNLGRVSHLETVEEGVPTEDKGSPGDAKLSRGSTPGTV